MILSKLLRVAAGCLVLGKCCIAISPSFSGEDPCPVACTEAGVNPGNWTVYHSVQRLDYCHSTLLLSFSVFNPLDNPLNAKTLRACTVDPLERNVTLQAQDISKEKRLPGRSVTFHQRSVNETGISNQNQKAQAQAMWNGSSPVLAQLRISGLGEQLRAFLQTGEKAKGITEPTLVFVYDAASFLSIGVYSGTGVATSPIMDTFSDFISSQGYPGDALVQACSKMQTNNTLQSNTTSYNFDGKSLSASVGIVAASGPHGLARAQRAVSQWANSTCVTEGYENTAALSTTLQTVAFNKAGANTSEKQLNRRGTCATTSVQTGDLCADLARRCGISTNDLLKYNTKKDFCTTLKVPQRVCCSNGDLPVAVPDANGNCKTHEVKHFENCWSIAQDNSNLFSVEDLESFNKNTWGWGGCGNLQATTIICLSPGNPPLPNPIPNAMCGPVKPGTVAPAPGTNLATLNPCPLNSCCDVWGFCGTTEEFCRPVPSGQAPGAPPAIGAPNCISNCGTDIVNDVSQ